jgi:hypothetical protein
MTSVAVEGLASHSLFVQKPVNRRFELADAGMDITEEPVVHLVPVQLEMEKAFSQ